MKGAVVGKSGQGAQSFFLRPSAAMRPSCSIAAGERRRESRFLRRRRGLPGLFCPDASFGKAALPAAGGQGAALLLRHGVFLEGRPFAAHGEKDSRVACPGSFLYAERTGNPVSFQARAWAACPGGAALSCAPFCLSAGRVPLSARMRPRMSARGGPVHGQGALSGRNFRHETSLPAYRP